MGTQWARKEAHTNELAAAVDSALEWFKEHRQAATWVGLGLIGSVVFIAVFINRTISTRDRAWSRLAVAQNYAYSGQGPQALEQLSALYEEYPSLLASGYGQLLAGDIFFQQAKYKEAQEAYQKILDQPQNKTLLPLAMADLGLSKEASGDCKAALETDQRFLDSYQDHFMAPEVHASLARCFDRLGQADKAKAAWQRMVFLYPETYWSDWAKTRTKTQ